MLHQIWLGPKPCPLEAVQTWRDQHPGWEHVLWTEASLPTLQNQALFDALHGVYHAQADVLRYEILQQFGGIYLDADSVCLRPLDDSFLQHDFWVCAEPRGLLANGFMGAVPKHPLMTGVIAELQKIDVDAVTVEDRRVLHGAAWILTGPCCLSEVAKELGTSIHVYPTHYFLPVFHDGTITSTTDDVEPYAHHWWGSTHHDNPTNMQNALALARAQRRLK